MCNVNFALSVINYNIVKLVKSSSKPTTPVRHTLNIINLNSFCIIVHLSICNSFLREAWHICNALPYQAQAPPLPSAVAAPGEAPGATPRLGSGGRGPWRMFTKASAWQTSQDGSASGRHSMRKCQEDQR